MSRVQHEPPSQRLHFRVKAPATVTIEGVDYPAADWSLGGFLVDGFGGAARPGDRLQCTFTINFQGFYIAIQKEVDVVRVEDNGTRVAFRFAEVSERERELLNYYVSNLMTGQMVPVEEVIKRIDTPVKPVPITPDEKVAESVPLRRQNIRRAAFSILYLSAGGILGLFLLLTLYSHFFRLDVDSAVITKRLEQVVSRDLGVVKEILVTEGMKVARGQVLLRIEDDMLARELSACRKDLDDAKLTFASYETRRGQEEDRLAAYRKIAAEKLTSAQQAVQSLESQLQTAELEWKRARDLLDSGIGSQSLYDEATARKALLEGDLDRAKAEQRIATEAAGSVRKGFFYDGRSLVGQMPELRVEAEKSRQSIPVLQRRLEEVEKRAERLVYRASFPAKVVRVTKSVGGTVDRGETLLVLERTDEDPVVDAFLTQDAASYVRVGAKARILVPALNARLNGKVVSVDRTYGFRSGLEDAYKWRHDTGASAHVELTFTDLGPDTREELTGGMPALVNIPRSFTLRAMR